jgi:hypothetical protein
MATKISYAQFLHALYLIEKLDSKPLKTADFHHNTFLKIEKATNKVFEALGKKYRVQSMGVGSSASIRTAVIDQLEAAKKHIL